jgi:hypothetical protein
MVEKLKIKSEFVSAHNLKTHRERRGIAALILNLGNAWR